MLLGLCVVRAAASLAFELDSGPPKVQGFPVGTKIVWMSMVRERVQNESHMTVLRGVRTVDASGKLEVDRADRDYSRSLWLLADLDGGWVVHGATAQYPPSSEVLAVQTQKGADRLIVHAQSIHLTWSSGHGIWLFAGADGGGQDADGLQNGVIVVLLANMTPFRGKTAPPAALAAGDLILAIDPDQNRTAVERVLE